jgi:hypothetical protein
MPLIFGGKHLLGFLIEAPDLLTTPFHRGVVHVQAQQYLGHVMLYFGFSISPHANCRVLIAMIIEIRLAAEARRYMLKRAMTWAVGE